jgi:hypothetical protein
VEDDIVGTPAGVPSIYHAIFHCTDKETQNVKIIKINVFDLTEKQLYTEVKVNLTLIRMGRFEHSGSF